MIDLAKDEKILLVIHRHWFVLAMRIFVVIFIYFFPFAIYLYIESKGFMFDPTVLTFRLEAPVFFLGAVIWTLLVWMRIFADFTDHYLDGWVVTDKRIIDVEQKGFFSRTVSSFRMERIQDVTVEIHGIIATLLDFGDVHVQTASEDYDFIIRDAPKPKSLKKRILEESDNIMDSQNEDA